MAFGGEATGNRKAQEQHNVKGTINWSGAIFMDWAWRNVRCRNVNIRWKEEERKTLQLNKAHEQERKTLQLNEAHELEDSTYNIVNNCK